uniref:Uncharacterized protein n=1 Tax=Amphimedon queenslandica TaxID=400682 RepID=A0A1X7TG06_AMPQE
EDQMGFDNPTMYWQLNPKNRVAATWDSAVHQASEEYSHRMHNLFCMYSSPPNKASISFSSQKDRQDWEHTLHSLQLSLPKQQGPSSTHYQRTHTDPPKTALSQFMWHVTLPSCRVGSELFPIAVPNGMYNQLFVCINDVCGRGNITILNSWSTSKDTPPQLVATLPLSSSRLICSLCVEHMNITLANAHSSFPDDSRSSTRLPLTLPTAPPTDRAPLEPDELLCPSPQSITDRPHPLIPPSSHRTSSYIVSRTQKE